MFVNKVGTGASSPKFLKRKLNFQKEQFESGINF